MAMTRHARPYKHPARQLTGDDRERGVCTICDRPVATTLGGRLRHLGEARPPLVTDPADAAVIAALAELVHAALGQLGADATDHDRARVAAETAWLAGAVRTRRAAWRPPSRRAA